MGAGAVIKINYDYPAFGPGFITPVPGSVELFSDVIEPIKKAKSFGRTIKTELQKISMQMDVGSTIEHLIAQESESAKAKSEIAESANNARADQEVVYGALTNVTDKLTAFGETVVVVDRSAASLIRERKLEFNRRYPHLESESEYRQRMDERSGWEKVKDFGYGLFHGGIIGGFDSLFNGRERFVEHKEAIKQKIAEFATKVGNWVKENWEAIVAAVVVVVAAIACIASFGAGTVFLVASIAAFAYAVTDKIVAINNGGKGIVETLDANGFHHLSQICKGFNWGLQITMLISGFKMSGLGAEKLFIGKASWLANTNAATLINGFQLFKGGGFLATVGNGAIFGGAYNYAVDYAAYGLNFAFSKDAQANPTEYFKLALTDTLKDTATGFVIGGTVAGISHIAINSFSFVRNKIVSFSRSNSNVDFRIESTSQTQVEIGSIPDDCFGTYKTNNGGTITVSKGKDFVNISCDKQTAQLLELSDKTPTFMKYETTIGGVKSTSYKVVFEQNSSNITLTSAERMSNHVSVPGATKSAAALGTDGQAINIHHLTPETSNGLTVYVELNNSYHEQMTKSLHSMIGSGESFRNDDFLNKQFNNFSGGYWQDRLYRILEQHTGSDYGRSIQYQIIK